MVFRIAKIAAWTGGFIFIAGLAAYLTLTLIVAGHDTVIVPDLTGKKVIYVLEILTDLGLNAKIKAADYNAEIPKDHVIYQEPAPGFELKKGRDVKITVSKGTQTVAVPSLTDFSIQQAGIILEEHGLKLGVISKVFTAQAKKEHVFSQSPTPGQLLARNAKVDLLVSRGERPTAYLMPDLAGMFLDDAVMLLESRYLTVEGIRAVFNEQKPKNTILGQNPPPGYRIEKQSPVKLIVNRLPGESTQTVPDPRTGIALFRYLTDPGFLRHRIRVRLNAFGLDVDIFDEYVSPNSEIWLLIPRNNNATVTLYNDEELILMESFD